MNTDNTDSHSSSDRSIMSMGYSSVLENDDV